MSRRNRVPRRIAQIYFREIRQLIEEDRRRIWQAFTEEIRPRIQQYRRLIENRRMVNNRLVANDAMDEIDNVLNRLRRVAEEETFRERTLLAISREFVEGISDRQRRGFLDQVRRVVGFDPTEREPWLASFLETAVQENVSYIKSIGTDYHDQVERIISTGVRRGVSVNDMAHDIRERADVSKSRARFIARDQVGSIHGDIAKARNQNLGLEKFRWLTSSDERVRESHAELDGEVFTWKDGARNERGEQIFPGTDYNCRCTHEPVREELEKIAEEAA